MNLLKTSSLNAISSIIKLFTSFFLNKFLAVYLGPAGVATVGQFQNFINIIITFSNGGINVGVTKYIADYEDETKKRSVISSSFIITLICSTFISIFIIIFNDYLSLNLIRNKEFSYIFIIFSVTLIFYSLNNLILSILNGYKQIYKIVIINIISSIFSALYSLYLVAFYKLDGILIAYVTSQSIIFIISLYFIWKEKWLNLNDLFGLLDKGIIINLSKYSSMSIISILCVNFSQMYVRSFIYNELGDKEAGYWNSMLKLSDMYLMFITMTLNVYYLPKLAEIKENFALKKEIISVMKLVLPLLAIVNLLIYLLRDFIIKIVFSDSFLPMSDLFAFQMLGDFFKILSWLLSYIMVAKAMTKYFIITELIFSLIYIILIIIFVKIFGMIGISYAWTMEYFLYTITMVYIFRKILFSKEETKNI